MSQALTLSRHAKTRMSQRGIKESHIEQVVALGRRSQRRKAIIYFFGRKELKQMQKDKALSTRELKDLEALKNIHVIIHQRSGVVATVYKNEEPNLRGISL